MTDQKNTILAIVLSALVLIGWQYFFGMPQMEKQKQIAAAAGAGTHAAAARRRRRSNPDHAADRRARRPVPGHPAGAGPPAQRARPDHDARGRARRVAARAHRDAEPRRLDRAQGRADRRSRADASTARPSIRSRPPIVLLSPSGSPHPFYAEFGWVGGGGHRQRRLPTADTVWPQEGSGALDGRPAGDADLGQRRGPRVPPHHRGRRQVSVHRQGRGRQQGRRAGDALSLRADLAPRHAADARLLHPARRPDRRARRQGPAGRHLQARSRRRSRDHFNVDQRLARHHRQVLGGDAAARHRRPRFRRASPSSSPATIKTYQTDYLLDPQTIAPGATGAANARLFAGAKEVAGRRRLRQASSSSTASTC